MNIACNDRERIFVDGTAEEWRALELHAGSCPGCAEELRVWKNLSRGAQELHEEWQSPELWPRIARALAERQAPKVSRLRSWFKAWRLPALSWQAAAAAFLVVAITGSAVWFAMHQHGDPFRNHQALLKDSAVEEVERAQSAYVHAIKRLAAEARPQLENPSTPLLASYHEKLLVLDSAIMELRAQADQNPGNAHVRRELLAMYQEKQETLQQVLEEKQ